MKKHLEVERYEYAPSVFITQYKLNPAYRNKWRRVRKQVLKRDNYTCLLCGITQEKLLENPTGALNKDYLNVCHLGDPENLELDMLATLCWECHKKVDGRISVKNEQGKTIGSIHDKKLEEESRAKLREIFPF